MRSTEHSYPGLMPWSSAVSHLTKCMWAGVSAPEYLKAIRRTERKLRVNYGPWKQNAGKTLFSAAKNGALRVFAVPDLQRWKRNRAVPLTQAPELLPPDIIRRLIAPRGTLPDHPYRATLRTTGGDQKLLAFLEAAVLMVDKAEYREWYRRARANGKWASQAYSKKPRRIRGRPSKRTRHLLAIIVSSVRDGSWTKQAGLTSLRRLLITRYDTHIPNPATLGKAVDQLWLETGDPEFRRAKRRRSKAAPRRT